MARVQITAPRLLEGALVAEHRPGVRLSASIPDPRALRLDDLASANFASIIRGAASEQWQLAAQKDVAVLASRIGISVPEQLRGVTEVLQTQVLETARSLVRESELLDSIRAHGIGLGLELSSAIPILGAVVKVLFAVASFVRRARQDREKYGEYESRPEQGSRFDPSVDVQLYNTLVFDGLHRRELGPLFQPVGTGLPSGGDRPSGFYLRTLDSGALVLVLDQVVPGHGGVVPGTAWLHVRPEAEGDAGEVYPTVRSEGVDLWGQLGRVGPLLYAVDAAAARKAWLTYLANLRQFLLVEVPAALQGGDDRIVSRGARETFGAKAIRGWAKRTFDRYAQLDRFGWREQGNLSESTPARSLASLIQLQHAALEKGVLAAYVDESSSAIRTDQSLQATWSVSRRRILDTQAYLVQADAVPDAAYAAAIRARQLEAAPDVIVAPDTTPGEPAGPEDLPRLWSPGTSHWRRWALAAALGMGAAWGAWRAWRALR